MQRVESVLELQRVVPALLAHRFLEIRAESRRDIGGDGDAPHPAHRVEPQCHVVIARQLDELLPAGEALCGNTAEIPGRVFDSEDPWMPRYLGERVDRD